MILGYRLSLVGGLGNQLYILAYADYLRRTHGISPLIVNWNVSTKKLPNGGGGDRTERSPFQELIDALGEKYIHADINYIRLKKILNIFKCIRKSRELPQCVGVFSPSLPPTSNKYLIPLITDIEGYFQSHHYIDDSFKARIREYVSRYSSPVCHEITDTDVAVHIRRGDFLKAQEVHNIFFADYYLSALRRVAETSGKINRVFIFSDDFNAITEEVATLKQYYEVVCVEGLSVLEDFYALTMFKRYALANSTFSWWAAMCSQYGSNTTVVVPKSPIKIHHPQEGFYPQHWIQF